MIKETQKVNYEVLKETVTNGNQYAIVHVDAMDETIPLNKLAITNVETDAVEGYLKLNGVKDLLGFYFQPSERLKDHLILHWCFDEKRIKGVREQDLLIGLLTSLGYTNMRDLDNDGVNDSEVKDMDWDTIQARIDAGERFFGFFSKVEVKHVPTMPIEV